MIPEQVSTAQRQLLAEIGHLHLVLDSHQSAARFCRQQLRQLRAQLEQLEQSPQPPQAR